MVGGGLVGDSDRVQVESRNTIAAFVLGVGLSGCGGGGQGDAASEESGGGTGASATEGEDSTGGDDSDPAASCRVSGVAFTPMRRLTRTEYNNTVRDLLGDSTAPALAFQQDDAAAGFAANGSTPVTQLHVEQYAAAAEDLASQVELDTLLPCDPAAGEEACATEFIEDFGRRAYRRPLTDAEVTELLGVYETKRTTAGFEASARLTLRAILQSPHFLYRAEFGDPSLDAPEGLLALSRYELASRLSYTVWASAPDDTLLDAAQEGVLNTAEGLEVEARRMLQDPRAVDAMVSFHEQWLELDRFETSDKPGNAEFNDSLRASMLQSARLFFAEVIQGEDATVHTLFSANYAFSDNVLASVLGVEVAGTAFERVELPPERASGILGMPAVLAATSHDTFPSPVKRGVLVRKELLCDPPPAPPPDVDDSPPQLDPKATGRDLYEQMFAPAQCAACHSVINPIGYGFEHFDALGRWRDTDNGQSIDAAGELLATQDIDGPFEGLNGLAEQLADSSQVRQCVQDKWFRFALGRWEDKDAEACSIDMIALAFEDSGYDIRELIVAIVVSDAFRFTAAE